MTDVERKARLEARARELVNFSVADQMRILAREGFTLADTNWENWQTDPEAETIIPIATTPPRGCRYES